MNVAPVQPDLMSEYDDDPTYLREAVLFAPPPIRSKLRIVAGSDIVTFNYPHEKPNWFVRLMTRWLLRMEWVDA